MADYHVHIPAHDHVQEYVREMNLAAVKLAREVADEFSTPDKPRFVAGSIGPTNKTCSMSPDVNNPAMRALTYDELAEAYREQMEALLEGGVDTLLIETIFDTLNAKAAIFAAEKAMEATGVQVPVMLSVTVSDAYRNLNLDDHFFRPFFELLVGRDYVRKMIKEGKSADEIKAMWKDDVEKFKVQRKPYLLYEE